MFYSIAIITIFRRGRRIAIRLYELNRDELLIKSCDFYQKMYLKTYFLLWIIATAKKEVSKTKGKTTSTGWNSTKQQKNNTAIPFAHWFLEKFNILGSFLSRYLLPV